MFCWIGLIKDPCFPIKFTACDDATSSLMEQNAAPATPDKLTSSSPSERPVTRLNTLITATIAGDNAASSSSLPDIRTCGIVYEDYHEDYFKERAEQNKEVGSLHNRKY